METNDETLEQEAEPLNDGNIVAETVDLSKACAINVTGERVVMDKSFAAVVKADTVHMENSFALILSTDELEGNGKAIFTPQTAMIAGGIILLGLLLFRRS